MRIRRPDGSVGNPLDSAYWRTPILFIFGARSGMYPPRFGAWFHWLGGDQLWTGAVWGIAALPRR
jgi:hypothetical protein